MWKSIIALDRILRGEATGPATLRQGRIDVPLIGLTAVLVALGMIYGACMGVFALIRAGDDSHLQLLASTLKVPALFLLTLLVTFPSLYVFNALVGSRLSAPEVLRLLIAALGVNLAVLASMGPIVAFFSLSTTSYPFMVLLNVLIFAVAGFLGLAFLLQTLHRLTLQDPVEAAGVGIEPIEVVNSEVESTHGGAAAGNDSASETTSLTTTTVGPLDRIEGYVLSRHVKAVFRCWVVVFGLVGAQMAWVLRPFIGDPDRPFAWFRERESNFFQAVLGTLRELIF